jgi:hypothetical protein
MAAPATSLPGIQNDKIFHTLFFAKIAYMKYVNVRPTGLVTFCVETAFYNGLLKER